MRKIIVKLMKYIIIIWVCSFLIIDTCYCEIPTDQLNELKTILEEVLLKRINDPMFKQIFMKYFPKYYEKVLSDKYFIKSFIEIIPFQTLIRNKNILDIINQLFLLYIQSPVDVIQNLLTYKIHIGILSNDIVIILHQYASLLPVSNNKFNLITNVQYIEEFLRGLETKTTVRQMLELYNNQITSIKVDNGRVYLETCNKIYEIILNGGQEIIQNYIGFHVSEIEDFIWTEQFFKNIITFYNVYYETIDFSFEKSHGAIVSFGTAPIETHIITQGASQNIINEFIQKKEEITHRFVISLIKLKLNLDFIQIHITPFIKVKVLWYDIYIYFKDKGIT